MGNSRINFQIEEVLRENKVKVTRSEYASFRRLVTRITREV
jgi:hypothetical protein